MNPQYSFCLSIAGRVLFAHSTYHILTLHPAFGTIVTSLNDIARPFQWNPEPPPGGRAPGGHTSDSISLAFSPLPMSFEQFQVQEDGSSGLGIMPNSMAYGASNPGMEM